MPRALPRLAALAATAAMLGLAACAAQSPDPTPSPTTDAADAPLFATDEEALAAAVAAYEAYLAVDAAIAADGGADAERIRDVVATHYAPELEAQYASQLHSGAVMVGEVALDDPQLVEWDQAAGITYVSVHGCLNVEQVRIIDRSGEDRTPAGRDPVVPLTLTFEGKADALVLSRSDLWSGDDFC